MSLQVETTLEPLALLDELQDIERTMGRAKLIDKGPRNIDLDILMYGDETIAHERLQVPHIGIPEREFVLRPLAEYDARSPFHALCGSAPTDHVHPGSSPRSPSSHQSRGSSRSTTSTSSPLTLTPCPQ